MNVYETLIFFDRDYSKNPYNAGNDLSALVPMLATQWVKVKHVVTGESVGTGNGATTMFSLAHVPLQGLLTVYFGGVEVDPSTYTVAGKKIIFDTAPPNGVAITADYTYIMWSFKIRTGVQFHNGNPLTPADAEYSFEREMVQDRADGPQWMLFEPLLEAYGAARPTSDPYFGIRIDDAVESNSTHVMFNLVAEYPELAFLQIWAQNWASVLNKAWAIAEGDFNGNWAPISGNYTARWEYIYNTWHNPETSYLEDAITKPTGKDGGTGPYEYDYWTSSVAYSCVRNDGGAPDPRVRNPDPHAYPTPATTYWDGWPARIRPGGATRVGNSVERVTWNVLPTWTTRLSRFLAGDSDYAAVPRIYRDQVLGMSQGGELLRAYWRSPPNAILALSMTTYHATFNISATTTHLGAFDPAHAYGSDPLAWGDDRAPADLFNDINVRTGFRYAFDYDWYIATAQLNEGEQPSDDVVKGLAYDNVMERKATLDMTKAAYYLKLAWGGVDNAPLGPPWGPEDLTGTLWNQGMSFDVTYNVGNVGRELAANEISSKVNSLNPTKFKLTTLAMDWGGAYLPAMVAQELPIFIIGWLADYADPHDFTFPFQHSAGTYAYSQAYSNPVVDALVQAGIAQADDITPYDGSLDNANGLANLDNKPAGSWRTWSTDPDYYLANPLDLDYPRRAIYYALQEIWVDDISAVTIVQGLIRGFEQAWIRGWYYNALAPGIYARDWYKAMTHFGDTNNDGAVNILDVSTLSSSWTGPPKGPAYFLPQSDTTGGIGGTTGSNEGGVKGLPNGKVEIDDLSLVSAYWDGPPKGPSHTF